MLASAERDEQPAETRDSPGAAAAYGGDAASAQPARPVVPVVVPAESGPWSLLLGGAVVLAVLGVMSFAGILLARTVGGGDDPTPTRTAATTIAATTPATTHPTATAAPERPETPPSSPTRPSLSWGPLTAEPAARLAVALEGSAVASTGGRLVVLGGRNERGPQSGVLLGPPRGVVRRVASLPAPLSAGAPLVLPDAVYVIGGERSRTVSDGIVRFDLATASATAVGRFFEPLAGAGHAQIGESLVLVGGWTGEKLATAVLRYSLNGALTVVARLPAAMRDSAVAVLGGRVYVAGGLTAAGPSSDVYSVELDSGTVALVGKLPRAVWSAVLIVFGSELYLLGGRAAGGVSSAVVHIDPQTSSITPAGGCRALWRRLRQCEWQARPSSSAVAARHVRSWRSTVSAGRRPRWLTVRRRRLRSAGLLPGSR